MALTGSYRKIVVKPENLTWDTVKLENNTDGDSKDFGIKVAFDLPSSSYATVCLREIMGEEYVDI